MKPIATLAIMLATACLANAKEIASGTTGQNTPAAHAATAAKTTSSSERVIAYSYRQLSSTNLLDTSHYYYSGSRGSIQINWDTYTLPYFGIPDYQNIKCDSYTYQINNSLAGHFLYDIHNRATAYSRYDTTGSGTGLLLNTVNEHPLRDATGRMIADSFYYPLSGPFLYDDYIFYDGNGYLIEDSMYNVTNSMPAIKTLYTNDANGNNTYKIQYQWSPVTSSWGASQQSYYTYDANNNRTTGLTQQFMGTWNNTQKDTFSFPATGNLYTYKASFTWSGSNWAGSTAFACHINGLNLWDTITIFNWNTATLRFDTLEKDYQTYDSYNNLQYAGGIAYNLTTHTYASAPYDLNTYYYEPYTTSAVAIQTAAAAQVQVYPNPVVHTLTVKPLNAPENDLLKVTLFSLTGAAITSYCAPAHAAGSIDMSNYPAGIYLITVENAPGTFTYMQKVVKN